MRSMFLTLKLIKCSVFSVSGRELIRTSSDSLRLLVAKTESRSSSRSFITRCWETKQTRLDDWLSLDWSFLIDPCSQISGNETQIYAETKGKEIQMNSLMLLFVLFSLSLDVGGSTDVSNGQDNMLISYFSIYFTLFFLSFI